MREVSFQGERRKEQKKKKREQEKRTLSARVGLHEPGPGAGLLKLGRQPCQLREHLVDDAHVGREVVLVEVQGKEPADVAEPADDQHRRLLRHGVFLGGLVCRFVCRVVCVRGEVGC
jgi:hypothetical protein